MNDEWMLGRNKRGCEGIFPISYVDIKIPLQVEPDSGTASRSASVSPAVISHPVRALYSFDAETAEDLTIKVRINPNDASPEKKFQLIHEENISLRTAAMWLAGQ
jgi:hypothetical protein